MGDEVPASLVAAGPGVQKVIVMFQGVEIFAEWVSDSQHANWVLKRFPLDSRILRIKTRHGSRARDWKDLTEDSVPKNFSVWPIPGPRSTPYCLKYLNVQQGGAADRAILFQNLAKLNASDWGMAEYSTLLEVVKIAGTYDQVNVANLASFEVIFRRLQTLEYCYSDRAEELSNNQHQRFGPRLTMEEQSAFMGLTRSQVCMVDPQLLSYIREHVKERADLSKCLRLAREEREGRQRGSKNKKKEKDEE